MINSREISSLHPNVARLCYKLIEISKREGIKIIVTSTLRDVQYQRYLFEKVPGSTNTPLVGAHGFGFAFDVVPMVNGKAIWNNHGLWNKIGALGKSLGLEWGGDWKSIIDKPHFEYTQGLSGADLRAGKRPKFPDESEGVDIMKYALQPIAKGKITTTSLGCKSAPSNNAKGNGTLRPENIFNIYAKCKNEGIEWYLVNLTTE
jgi:hypothetical protein